ncbi:AraC family transcriptional regulator [Bosea sp. BK604]|uniref:AraC family transcriptional regulator n=1 Tax=Bosea sp. BK604 TaxID=2512180 RepID=UPI001043F802|nr:AraC family transcriptional regulator [Bosea sp. BK604]TCR61515.1 AraC family transcriptional regulator [Bosea sp. BK604]
MIRELQDVASEYANKPDGNVAIITILAIRELLSNDINPIPLLKESGMPSDLSIHTSERVPVNIQSIFLDLAANALNDDLLGFHLALSFDFRALGFIYYLVASAETLGEALANEEEYSASLNEPVRVGSGRTSGVSVELSYEGLDPHLDRHFSEFWITGTLRLCRDFTSRELVPTSATMIHLRVGKVPEMDRYFGREVIFGADRDLLEFGKDAGDLPLVTHDPHLHQLLRRLQSSESTMRAPEPESLQLRVEKAIAARLRYGTVTIDAIARDVGTSARTLTRKLAEERMSFSSILDGVRASLAVRYMRNGELTMSQLAWLLGYRESSTLVRAFKRWTGKRPTEFRRELRRGGLDDT